MPEPAQSGTMQRPAAGSRWRPVEASGWLYVILGPGHDNWGLVAAVLWRGRSHQHVLLRPEDFGTRIVEADDA